MPWGATTSSAPLNNKQIIKQPQNQQKKLIKIEAYLTVHIPRFVANITMGAIADSRAL